MFLFIDVHIRISSGVNLMNKETKKKHNKKQNKTVM